MARGQDTGSHPNRQVSLESFLGIGSGVIPSGAPAAPATPGVIEDFQTIQKAGGGRLEKRGNRAPGRGSAKMGNVHLKQAPTKKG
jgi:hypothetical protein